MNQWYRIAKESPTYLRVKTPIGRRWSTNGHGTAACEERITFGRFEAAGRNPPSAERGQAERTAVIQPSLETRRHLATQTAEIESQSRPSAALIHETIRAKGEQELERRWWAILMSGLAAGLSIGLSLVVQGEFHAALSDQSAQRLVAPLGYTVGFLVVVLGRQQLFTENTLTPILPLLHHRNLGTLIKVLKLWGLVLASNIAGTWAIGYGLARGNIFRPEVTDAFLELSRHTVDGTFSATFVRAVFAGWLIALMMWLLPATKGSRVQVIVIMTYVVALGEFSHIVAGSVECAYLVQRGQASIAQYGYDFFLPTLLGNILGGTTLVALLNYGQVAAELDEAGQ